MRSRNTCCRGLDGRPLSCLARPKAEDQRESLVYSLELARVEAPGGAAQALWVDERGLLDEDPGLGVV